jgi:hypothetical protein
MFKELRGGGAAVLQALRLLGLSATVALLTATAAGYTRSVVTNCVCHLVHRTCANTTVM